ncbi:UNVERIFIED_CONTAM: hypothetical protein FKN15_034587 [Acipenser sinensis]
MCAISGEKTFNVYICPRKQISEETSSVNGFTVKNQTLFLDDVPMETKSHKEALTDFLAFLVTLHRPLLVGHNLQWFDRLIVSRIMSEFCLLNEFQKRSVVQEGAGTSCDQTEDVTLVFFDLETTGLDIFHCDIIQVSAISGDKIFNVYTYPRQQISEGASAVTGFTVANQTLFRHGVPIETKTHEEALTDFLAFLGTLHRPVLAGMMENKENIGDSLNSKKSDKGTPLLECAGCLPSPAPAADQNIPVEDHSIVFFDLETTGLGTIVFHGCKHVKARSTPNTKNSRDKFQLAIRFLTGKQHSVWNQGKDLQCLHGSQTPIVKGASAVIGFTVRRHKLYLHRRPVQTKTHRDCLMSFLAFLRALNQPLLAGHNIKRFDCPILARVLEEFQLNEQFKLLVSGFLDTLILSKDLLQNTGIKSFKQENLVKELLKKSYPAHNALEDVKALQDLYSALRPTPAQITSHLFTLDHMESHMSLQPLVEGKAISKTTAQKLARLGFNFEKMKRSHLQNPSEGLQQFLEPLKEELKNSMFTKTLDKICDFFKIEQ